MCVHWPRWSPATSFPTTKHVFDPLAETTFGLQGHPSNQTITGGGGACNKNSKAAEGERER